MEKSFKYIIKNLYIFNKYKIFNWFLWFWYALVFFSSWRSWANPIQPRSASRFSDFLPQFRLNFISLLVKVVLVQDFFCFVWWKNKKILDKKGIHRKLSQQTSRRFLNELCPFLLRVESNLLIIYVFIQFIISFYI